jgi:hypothetical protein
MPMQGGEAFLLPDFDDHLWAVISDPVLDPHCVVVVLFVSWTDKYDQACVLNGGEHPFIKHPTCVQYPGAKIVTDGRLEELRRSGQLRPKAPLSGELLALIRQRAAVANISTRAYEILREQGFVP